MREEIDELWRGKDEKVLFSTCGLECRETTRASILSTYETSLEHTRISPCREMRIVGWLLRLT